MVTPDEITRAVELIRATGRLTDAARFVHVVLHEPSKEALAQWKPGDPVDRELQRARRTRSRAGDDRRRGVGDRG